MKTLGLLVSLAAASSAWALPEPAFMRGLLEARDASRAKVADAARAHAQTRYVNMNLYRNGSSYFSLNEGSLGVNLSVNAFGNGFSFNGFPFSGHVSGSGSWYNLYGGGERTSPPIAGGQTTGWTGPCRSARPARPN